MTSLQLLLRRLRASAEDRESQSRFEAMPDLQLGPQVLSGASSPSEYRELVGHLRDEFATLSGSARFALASGLWDIVDEPWVALDVLGEWLLDGDEDQVRLTLTLLDEMPWRHLFALAYPLALLVEQITLRSTTVAEKLTATLQSIAQTGSWQRTPGQSADRHIETRDQALEVAQRLVHFPAARALYEQIAATATAGMTRDADRDDEERMLFGR